MLSSPPLNVRPLLACFLLWLNARPTRVSESITITTCFPASTIRLQRSIVLRHISICRSTGWSLLLAITRHRCFGGVTEAGCSHQVIVTGSGPIAARTPAFKWVNTALGNIKAAITGTYRSISSKHVPRYLAEFEYRFNRRYDLAAMIPRLTWAGVRTPPMPYRLLKMAEGHA